MTDSTRSPTTLFAGIFIAALSIAAFSPVQAQNFFFTGYLTFSDLSGTEHTLEFENLGPHGQDVPLPGYDWQGDTEFGGSNTGPDFHLSCSATLVGTKADVNLATASDVPPLTIPPFADGEEVFVVDFFFERQGPGGGSPTCSADDFPNLEIVKQASASEVEAGGSFFYEIVVSNPGSGTLSDVQVTDELDLLGGALAVDAIDPPSPACELTGNLLDCSLGELAGGDSVTIRVDLISTGTGLDSCGLVNNVASANGVATSGGLTVPLQRVSNETEVEIINCVIPEIEVTKTGPDTSKVGDEICWSISFENVGGADVENCTVDDTLGGTLGAISEGVPVPFCLTPDTLDTNPLENTATVTCDVTGTADQVSDSDDHSVGLIDPAITVTKTGPSSAKVGDEITYTIGFANTGTGAVENCSGDDTVLGNLGAFEAGVDRTFDYTIQPGDPDPLPNTATITCDVTGFDNQVSDDDSHSVALFDPAITVTKTGPSGAKVGDEITYTIGFADDSTGTGFPGLENCTGSDTLLGNLGAFEAGVDRTFDYTVQEGDDDPLPNTATITCDVVGFDNQVSDDDSHSVALFDPAITVTKTGPDIAKVGDEITYTIGFTDDSTGTGFPGFENCTGDDTVLGDLGAFEAGVDRTFDYTVQSDDPDPLPNTATITCDVTGFDNQVSDDDSHSVDLIDPEITVTKTGPDDAKVGDEVTFEITFENTGDTDLENCTGNDPLLGGDLGSFEPGVTREFPYSTDADDDNPLVNTVTITCDVSGMDNQVSDTDGHSIDLVSPGVALEKTCFPDPVITGGEITWEVTVTNSGNSSLDCELFDATAGAGIDGETFALEAGESDSFEASRLTTADDEPALSNTASVQCDVAGFDNQVSAEDTADCEVRPPSDAICRTPGFWGSHGGEEHRRATNLTQLVIDSGGPLSVCGATIDNTDVGNVNSALEAMCVQIAGEQQRQLARQLTAMALNCIVSGGDADCFGTSVEDLFTAANASCAANDGDVNAYIAEVDCFNNGGEYDGGVCVYGTCSVTGEECGDVECPLFEDEPQQCVPFEGNCHDRELDEETDIFDGVNPFPGPAGSSRACSAANGNGVKVVPAP